MPRYASRRLIALTSLALWLALSAPAHAYIDPGSGSYAFQVIIAGIMGAVFSIKLFWTRIKALFVRKTPSRD